jgi:hypothetical protein
MALDGRPMCSVSSPVVAFSDRPGFFTDSAFLTGYSLEHHEDQAMVIGTMFIDFSLGIYRSIR